MKSAILNETGTRTIKKQQEQEQSEYTLFYELHKFKTGAPIRYAMAFRLYVGSDEK